MSEMMNFPDTWEEFEKSYGFADSEEIYTNGSRLIPSFRVKQWLDHIAQFKTKRQAIKATDCISRKAGRMRNVVYPYNCPHFIPVPGDDYKCQRMGYHYSYDEPDAMEIGCLLGRKICLIALDLDNPKSPRTADEFFDGLYQDASEEERKTIEIHIRSFFERKLIEQKGGNGG